MIAGPNGAGKSTLSSTMLAHYGISAYDWDQSFYKKWKRFSLDPYVEEGIRNATNEEFESLANQSLNSKTSFAFETNFHVPAVIDLCLKFKEAGYTLVLYFLHLPNVQIAQERVNIRVSKGGHFVSEQTIISRHTQGLILLDTHFSQFDTCLILDASGDFGTKPMLSLEEGVVLEAFVSAEDLQTHLPTLAGLV